MGGWGGGWLEGLEGKGEGGFGGEDWEVGGFWVFGV